GACARSWVLGVTRSSRPAVAAPGHRLMTMTRAIGSGPQDGPWQSVVGPVRARLTSAIPGSDETPTKPAPNGGPPRSRFAVRPLRSLNCTTNGVSPMPSIGSTTPGLCAASEIVPPTLSVSRVFSTGQVGELQKPLWRQSGSLNVTPWIVSGLASVGGVPGGWNGSGQLDPWTGNASNSTIVCSFRSRPWP